MDVNLRGFRELDRALGELPKATARNVLRRVGRGALEPMADRAAALAPERMGRLSFSIAVSDQGTRRAQWKRNRYNFVIAMGPAAGTGSLFYATHVEFGTIDTPAQPYMRPAWDGGQDRALEYVKDELGNEISQAASRLARKAART